MRRRLKVEQYLSTTLIRASGSRLKVFIIPWLAQPVSLIRKKFVSLALSWALLELIHMASQMQIDRFFHRALKFPGPSKRIAALKTALSIIDEQIVHSGDQLTLRLHAELSRLGESVHPEDAELDWLDLKAMVEEALPKLLRGGFVISLWSMFEACVMDLVEYSCRTRNLPSVLHEWKRGDVLKHMKKFFDTDLKIKAFPDEQVCNRLRDLKKIRNALAHHDGSIERLPPHLRANNDEGYRAMGLKIFSDLHHEYFVPTSEFTHRSLDLVDACLESLAARVYDVLHPNLGGE